MKNLMESKSRPKCSLPNSAVIVTLIMLISLGWSSATYAQGNGTAIRQVRALETDEAGLTKPTGLAYSPGTETFYVIHGRGRGQPIPTETDIVKLTPFGDPLGSARIAAQIENPINVTFDSTMDRLLILRPTAKRILEIAEGPDGNLDPRSLTQHDASSYGLQDPQGMTADPATGRLFILDAYEPQLVRIEPGPEHGLGNPTISHIDLAHIGSSGLRGLAFDPTTGHLHILSPDGQLLYELTDSGQVQTTRDLSALDVANPLAMIFAPSGDLTDDVSQLSLYLADSGQNLASDRQVDVTEPRRTYPDSEFLPESPLSEQIFLPLVIGNASGNGRVAEGSDRTAAGKAAADSGQIIELSLSQPTAAAASSFQSLLVQTINTWQWSPSSPDPAGIVFLPASDTLLVSDSEVNEMAIFTGDNLFESTLSGTLSGTSTTISFSNEPTGVSLNPDNGHLFFSDDTGDRSIYELNPGPDGLYDTSDDIVTSFLTEDFGSMDPEGVTFATGLGVLFIADGVNEEIYRVDPGENGLFDGVPPTGDDGVTNFDTTALGLTDPEGIAYNPDTGNLYAANKPVDTLFEIDTNGAVVQTINVAAANARLLSGLAYAPSSLDPDVMSIYIVDRMVDNGSDPDENDGKIYEMSLPSSVLVSIVAPAEGNAVSGTAPVQIEASAPGHPPATLIVEWNIDGGPWYPATYNSEGEYYEANWDTTTGNDGIRTVNARAIDSANNIGIDSNDVIVNNINDSPLALFTYGCTDLTCNFDATGSSDPDGSIVSYLWSFGDGNIGSGTTTGHTYTAADTYTVILTVTDDMGADALETQNVPVGLASHIGDLNGSSATDGPGGKWSATVVVTVHDERHMPLRYAAVSGSWSDGPSSNASCTTDDVGQCGVTKTNINKNSSSVAFTVSDVSHATNAYQPAANHDADGDSNGTVITVSKDGGSTNQAPVASPDSYVTDVDMTLNVAAPGVLDNDSDGDGDALTAVLVEDVSNGTVNLAADGSFDYTPDPGYIGSDSFTYYANDGIVNSATVTVIITVNSMGGTTPIAADDFYHTAVNRSLSVPAPGVLDNDTDAGGNPLTAAAILLTDVSNGTLSLVIDGSFVYEPGLDFTGTDSFTYQANDGQADSNAATVTIIVNPEVTSIVPNSIGKGATIDVAIAGLGFVDGAELTFENGGGSAPEASHVVVSVDGTGLTATVTVKGGRPPRDPVWDVRVTNPDGSSGSLIDAFTVTAQKG